MSKLLDSVGHFVASGCSRCVLAGAGVAAVVILGLLAVMMSIETAKMRRR